MISAGKIPLTIQPIRLDLELRQMKAWECGENPSLNRSLGELYREHVGEADTLMSVPKGPKRAPRISWVGEPARERWQARLARLPVAIEEMTVQAARAIGERCAVRLVPESRFDPLSQLAAEYGLGAAALPAEALPAGIPTRPHEDATVLFLAGTTDAIANAQAAWERRDMAAFHALLDLPGCCLNHVPEHQGTVYLPSSAAAHPLLAPLGISALPVMPCRFDCPSAAEAAARWLDIAASHGYSTEAAWMRECFSWAISWSELHGVTEVKTPLFKMCFQNGHNSRTRLIQRAGAAAVECSVAGLSFPYAAPARHSHVIGIGNA
jgi:hypothetical protein